jgi:hypothetical protein
MNLELDKMVMGLCQHVMRRTPELNSLCEPLFASAVY